MGIPQVVFIALFSILFGNTLKDKEFKNIFGLVVFYIVVFGLLIWGGYFK